MQKGKVRFNDGKQPTDRQPTYIITKRRSYDLFFSKKAAKTCFISSYNHKFKSNNDSRIKTLFWASFSYLLINYTPEKVGILRIFRSPVIFNLLE